MSNSKKKGYKIYSLYNPSIVVFDGTKIPFDECRKIELLVRTYHETKNTHEFLLAIERSKYSQLLRGNLRKFALQDRRMRAYRLKNSRQSEIIQMHKEELHRTNEAYNDLQQLVENQSSDLSHLRDELGNLKKEVNDGKEEIRQLETYLSNLRITHAQELVDLKEEVNDAKDENRELDDYLSDLRIIHEETVSENVRLEETIERLHLQMECEAKKFNDLYIKYSSEQNTLKKTILEAEEMKKTIKYLMDKELQIVNEIDNNGKEEDLDMEDIHECVIS